MISMRSDVTDGGDCHDREMTPCNLVDGYRMGAVAAVLAIVYLPLFYPE
jgi:hypothetical protein